MTTEAEAAAATTKGGDGDEACPAAVDHPDAATVVDDAADRRGR